MVKLVALASLLLVASFLTVEVVGEGLRERVGYLSNMRQRLGHFNQAPFTDLYKYYATGFVRPNFPKRPNDDYRNFLPSGDECVVFFNQFRTSDYKLRDLEQFVLLDACLGYLYRNEYEASDSKDIKAVRDHLKTLKEDQRLSELWSKTSIEEIDPAKKECVANLLLNSILARYQFPNVACNNHFLQVYLQFAECQEDAQISLEDRKDDSYLTYIYDLLNERVKFCSQEEINHIETATRLAYEKERVWRVKNKLMSSFSPKHRQAKDRMLPKEILNLLMTFKNLTSGIDLREVNQLVRGVSQNDEVLKVQILKNMAYYADRTIKPNPSNVEGDPYGTNRYTKAVDKLCEFFRTSDDESVYDFATPIVRLVRLLNYEHLFGITVEEWVQKMLTQAKESAPIYLGLSACNILTYTQGHIEQGSADRKSHYVVSWKPDSKGMILWPDAGYY